VSKPKVPQTDADRLWKPGLFRLFLSHISAGKAEVAELSKQLRPLGVSAFVAHKDIEPSRHWQREIELALSSMHALAALLTPNFHKSNWTDQEIGFALGREVMVIPVRMGLDPYGFIGIIQGLNVSVSHTEILATEIVALLLNNKLTSETMKDALVVALEKAMNYKGAIAASKALEKIDYLSQKQVSRIELSSKNNDQVANATGVLGRIQNIVKKFNSATSQGSVI
jgi:hypothetical protein